MKSLAQLIADDKKETLKILELMKSTAYVTARLEELKRRNENRPNN